MPIKPPLVASIGAIKRFFMAPCATPPLIVAEAAARSIMYVIAINWVPSWKNVWKWAGGGKSWLCNLKEAASDAGVGKQFKEHAGGRYLYQATEFADKAARWLWILSMIDEFIVDWSSLALKWSGCKPDVATDSATGSPWVGAFQLDGTPGGLNWWIGFQPGGPVNAGVIKVAPGQQGNIIVSASPTDIWGKPIMCSAWIERQDTGQILDHTTSERDEHGNILPVLNWVNYHNQSESYHILIHHFSSVDDTGWPHLGIHGDGDSAFFYPSD